MNPRDGLRLLVVRGLFGQRDYDIEMDPARPTVLTGLNGTGKSTLLRLVNAVSTGNVRALAMAPLSRLELHFSHLPPFVLMRRANDSVVDITWGQFEGTLTRVPALEGVPEWAMQILEENATLEDADFFEILSDSAQSNGLTYPEYTDLRKTFSAWRGEVPFDAPAWLGELRTAFPVLFVTDQRLVVDSGRPPRAHSRGKGAIRSSRAVEAASSEIAEQMRRVDSAYARSSQMQDRRFPRDVIQAMSRQEVVPLTDLQELLAEVDLRRESLREVGLLDAEQDFEPELATESLEQEHVRTVIATFLRSTLDKFAVLEELSTRLRIFKNFLDDRFSPKVLYASRREGLRFRLSNGLVIGPGQLSSGEQQMMVLAYEILFRADPGTLVIIDEPEISLHVLWQDTLIDSLTEMGEPGSVQFLMASHSPVLLASHPELERSLDADD